MKWDQSEPIEKYMKDLERLVEKGFPDQNDQARKNMLIERFTDGLPEEISRELELHPRDTFAATVTRAKELIILFERRVKGTDTRCGGRPRQTAAFTGTLPTSREPPLELPQSLGYGVAAVGDSRPDWQRQETRQDDALASTLSRIMDRLERLEAERGVEVRSMTEVWREQGWTEGVL